MLSDEVLQQGWANSSTSGLQRVIEFDRRAKYGADAWNILVIHLLREGNNMESGQRNFD